MRVSVVVPARDAEATLLDKRVNVRTAEADAHAAEVKAAGAGSKP